VATGRVYYLVCSYRFPAFVPHGLIAASDDMTPPALLMTAGALVASWLLVCSAAAYGVRRAKAERRAAPGAWLSATGEISGVQHSINAGPSTPHGGAWRGKALTRKTLLLSFCIVFVSFATSFGGAATGAPLSELLMQRACDRRNITFPSQACSTDALAQVGLGRIVALYYFSSTFGTSISQTIVR
jgi:hypothetical protein